MDSLIAIDGAYLCAYECCRPDGHVYPSVFDYRTKLSVVICGLACVVDECQVPPHFTRAESLREPDLACTVCFQNSQRRFQPRGAGNLVVSDQLVDPPTPVPVRDGRGRPPYGHQNVAASCVRRKSQQDLTIG